MQLLCFKDKKKCNCITDMYHKVSQELRNLKQNKLKLRVMWPMALQAPFIDLLGAVT